MKKLELHKYPRSILIPVALFIIGMVVVFVVYKLNSISVTETPNITTQIKIPINTKANFVVDANVKIGENPAKAATINFSGKSVLNIDLSGGVIVLESLDLKSLEADIPEYNLVTTPVKVKLNTSYPSTGKIDLDTNNMDLSLDIILAFSFKKKGGKFTATEINVTIPLSGTIDRDSGIIKLSGEATIPPEKVILPLPISINVIATTEPLKKSGVNDK